MHMATTLAELMIIGKPANHFHGSRHAGLTALFNIDVIGLFAHAGRYPATP
jgi:hypothetical protein